MWQHHVLFLSEAFVIFHFGGIFIWHSSLHSSHSKLNKKKNDWSILLGSQPTISLDKAVSVFVLYIQILGIWKWVLVTLGLNFKSIKFLSSFNSLKWGSHSARQKNTAGEILDSRFFCFLKQRAVKLLVYLWKHSHNFTAKLCWGKLHSVRGGRARDCSCVFILWKWALWSFIESHVMGKLAAVILQLHSALCFTSCLSSVGEMTDSLFLLPWLFRGMRSDSSQTHHSSWYSHYARVGGMRKEYHCNWDYSIFPVMLKDFDNYRKKQFLYWHVLFLSRWK